MCVILKQIHIMASVEWWQLSYRNLRNRTNIMLSKAQNSEIDVKMMQFLILICPTQAHTLVTKSKKNPTLQVFRKVWVERAISKLIPIFNKARDPSKARGYLETSCGWWRVGLNREKAISMGCTNRLYFCLRNILNSEC